METDYYYIPSIFCSCAQFHNRENNYNFNYGRRVELRQVEVIEEFDSNPSWLAEGEIVEVYCEMKTIGMAGECPVCNTIYYIDYNDRYMSREVPY